MSNSTTLETSSFCSMFDFISVSVRLSDLIKYWWIYIDWNNLIIWMNASISSIIIVVLELPLKLSVFRWKHSVSICILLKFFVCSTCPIICYSRNSSCAIQDGFKDLWIKTLCKKISVAVTRLTASQLTKPRLFPDAACWTAAFHSVSHDSTQAAAHELTQAVKNVFFKF